MASKEESPLKGTNHSDYKTTDLEFGIALRLVDDEGVLFDEVSLLLLLGLPRLVLLLDLLDQPEGRVQVGAGGGQLAGFLLVGAAEGPENKLRTRDEFEAAFNHERKSISV